MEFQEALILAVKCIAVFILGAACFDVVHYILHIWENSRFSILRKLGGLHTVHHLFLDRQMKIQREFGKKNLFLHIVPEYSTAVVGMILLGFVFGWLPVLIVIALRTAMVIVYLLQKGEDFTHKSIERVNANRSLIFVGPHYHALHHVYVNQHYSSFINIFDMFCGTNCQIRDRKFLVTGARGAFGSAMAEELRKLGGVVNTAQHGVDFTADDYSSLKLKLEQADVVVLAHGAKGEAAWDANYSSFVKITELFRDLGRKRLVPPEVWAVGSESELHPNFGGTKEMQQYLDSKRAFAKAARSYYAANDITYRHIVPSAFTSKMGWGLMSAQAAVKISLFFIKRGFCYVPVTYTTIAFWNYIKFLALPRNHTSAAPFIATPTPE